MGKLRIWQMTQLPAVRLKSTDEQLPCVFRPGLNLFAYIITDFINQIRHVLYLPSSRVDLSVVVSCSLVRSSVRPHVCQCVPITRAFIRLWIDPVHVHLCVMMLHAFIRLCIDPVHVHQCVPMLRAFISLIICSCVCRSGGS